MIAKLKEFLDTSGVQYQPITHRIAFTAQEVAAAEHVPGREHAKVAIVKVPSGFFMAVLPAPKKVDLVKFAAAVQQKEARLASEEEFERMFPQCETGAMPPFGNLFGLPLIVDRTLEDDANIAFQAGTHTESVRMKYLDFKRLARPQVADIAA
jgi:Ala-tRNA(Pro) deacylase